MKTQKLITSTGKLIAESYAKVSVRVGEFHKGFRNGRIETSYIIDGDRVFWKAIVTLDLKTSERYFTGHSTVKLTGEVKQFEKGETIAVGRALAFAGFLSEGDIASLDEIEEYEAAKVDPQQSMFDKASAMIESASSKHQLNNLLDRIVSNRTDFTAEGKENLISMIDLKIKRIDHAEEQAKRASNADGNG